MIFDIPNVKSYNVYKSRNGPFICIFYYPYDLKNKEIFFKLRRISEIYKDVPVLRFDFVVFFTKYPLEIESYNDMLIIEKSKINKIEKCIDEDNILNIFEYARNRRKDIFKITNKTYRTETRTKLRRYVPFYFQSKGAIPFIKFIDNDESEYMFPNSHAILNNKEYIKNKIPNINPIKILEKNPEKQHPKSMNVKSSILKNEKSNDQHYLKCMSVMLKENNAQNESFSNSTNRNINKIIKKEISLSHTKSELLIKKIKKNNLKSDDIVSNISDNENKNTNLYTIQHVDKLKYIVKNCKFSKSKQLNNPYNSKINSEYESSKNQ